MKWCRKKRNRGKYDAAVDGSVIFWSAAPIYSCTSLRSTWSWPSASAPTINYSSQPLYLNTTYKAFMIRFRTTFRSVFLTLHTIADLDTHWTTPPPHLASPHGTTLIWKPSLFSKIWACLFLVSYHLSCGCGSLLFCSAVLVLSPYQCRPMDLPLLLRIQNPQF